MKRSNLGRRFCASTVATISGIVAMPFLVVEGVVKGVADTVIDTVATPVEDIMNQEIIEAPFDMVSSAVTGTVDTAAGAVKTAIMSPFTVGAQVYCSLAGEDANPRTLDFVKRTTAE